MSEQVFNYGKLSYQYDLDVQDRKTISLTVWPDMRLTLKTPTYATEKHVEKFLKRKWRWLDVQLKFFARYNKKKYRKEYIPGEAVLYLGKQYQLQVQKAEIEDVKLNRGKLLVLTTHNAYDGLHTSRLLSIWYRRKTREIFRERYLKVQAKFEYDRFPSLDIRPMPKRWGSFISKQKIVLNPTLIQASKECIDYVITHELCHVQYKNHGKQYWELLNRKCPDWEKIKDQLETRVA